MPSLTVKPHSLETGGGGRGPVDPRGFGGGGGRGDDVPNYGERLRRCRLGLALALAAISLLFVTFSATYLARQHMRRLDTTTDTLVQDWAPLPLPTGLLELNTLILLFSSISMEFARRQAAEQAILAPIAGIPGVSVGPRRPVPWLVISALSGMAFLGGQALAWRTLFRENLTAEALPGSSFFYILTGAHAAHLLCGLLALLYALVASPVFGKTAEARRIIVDITAWYWHAMAGLWLYVLAVLSFGNRPY